MKGLFITLSVVLISWVSEPVPASANEAGARIGEAAPAVSNVVDYDVSNPEIAVISRKMSGKYSYYGRGDHRHRHDRYFDRHRHGHIHPRFHGNRHFHSPYRPHPFDGKGFYHRPYRGRYFFGFTTCFHSGTARVCVIDPHPYRYRYR